MVLVAVAAKYHIHRVDGRLNTTRINNHEADIMKKKIYIIDILTARQICTITTAIVLMGYYLSKLFLILIFYSCGLKATLC